MRYKEPFPVFLTRREPLETPFEDDSNWREDWEIAPYQILFNTPRMRSHSIGTGSFRSVRVVQNQKELQQ